MNMKNNKKLKEKRIRKHFHARLIFVGLAFLLQLLIIFGLIFLLYFTSEYYYTIATVVFILVLNFIFALFIVNSKNQIDYKLTWVAIIAALPFIGVTLYILFANKVTTKKLERIEKNRINRFLKKQRDLYINEETLKEVEEKVPEYYNLAYLNSNSNFPVYKNTNIKYYKFGQEGIDDLIKMIRSAKKFIFVEYFIIEPGYFFDELIGALKDKAKEGVDVRLIYDDFGCSTFLPKNFNLLLREDGVKAFRFNPLKPTMNIQLNCRDHRKIVVVDGIKAFTGGINVGDEYLNKKERFGVWKDNFLYLEGEAVQGLTSIFLSNLLICDKSNQEDFDAFSYKNNKYLLDHEIINNDSFIQPASSMPYDQKYVLRNAFLQMINKAKKTIWLSTPYLIPDNELITALINASKSGVDVKIFTPGIPDKKMVWQATKSYYALFILAGIKVYEYTPGFNHEKTLVIDNEVALTGTCNFDFRSFYLHFEMSVCIYKDKQILKMVNSFKEMEKVSTLQEKDKYVNASWIKRLGWSLLRVIAPLL